MSSPCFKSMREQAGLRIADVVAACESLRSESILVAIEKNLFTPNSMILLDLSRLYGVPFVHLRVPKPQSVFSGLTCPGQRLRAAREMTRTTIGELAHALSVSEQRFRNYEHGAEFIPFEQINRIAGYLGVCASLLIFNNRVQG